jgi:hypothetical protein
MKELNELITRLTVAVIPAAVTQVQRREHPGSHITSAELSREQLSAVDAPTVAATLASLGHGARIELQEKGFGDDRHLTLLHGMPIEQRLEDYISTADLNSAFHAEVLISKEALLTTSLPSAEDEIRWYFSPDTASEVAKTGLPGVQQAWFRPRVRTVLIINGLPTRCHSPYFMLLPGDWTVGDIRDALAAAVSEDDWKQLDERLSRRRTETNWQGAPAMLSPDVLHLVCEPPVAPQDDLRGRLNKLCLDAVVGSLANYTEIRQGPGEDPAWLARFEGQKRVEIITSGVDKVEDSVCDQWFDLYDRAYSSRYVTDMINIIRNLLTLQPVDRDNGNCSILLERGADIAESSRAHYERYVGESIEKYFAKVKETAAFFQSKVDAVSQQINGLIDAFLKNLLAIAGFLIGTLVAKVADKTQASAVPVLLWAFVVYIAVSSTIYYVVSWKTYRLTRMEYDDNMENARRFFTPEDQKRYIGEAFKRRESLFLGTFGVTVAVYFLAFVAAIFFALHPNLVQSPVPPGAATPAPTAAPTASPVATASPLPPPTPVPATAQKNGTVLLGPVRPQ